MSPLWNYHSPGVRIIIGGSWATQQKLHPLLCAHPLPVRVLLSESDLEDDSTTGEKPRQFLALTLLGTLFLPLMHPLFFISCTALYWPYFIFRKLACLALILMFMQFCFDVSLYYVVIFTLFFLTSWHSSQSLRILISYLCFPPCPPRTNLVLFFHWITNFIFSFNSVFINSLGISYSVWSYSHLLP